MGKLDGKSAIITGASRGIGQEISELFAAEGAKVVCAARTVTEGDHPLEGSLARTIKNITDNGGEAIAVAANISVEEECLSLVEQARSAYGPVDILVNNAGMTRRGAAHEVDLDDWQQVLDLNLNAVFALSQAFARQRIASGEPGKIINIGSLMSQSTRPNNAPYAASKGGILLLTKALSVDWAPHRILVNAIGPGYIQTPLNQALVDDPEFSQWVEGRCHLGRWGQPSDLVGAAVFLASPASDFVTGQMLYVDGGWLARF